MRAPRAICFACVNFFFFRFKINLWAKRSQDLLPKKTQKFVENFLFLATSGHQNSAMITDGRKLRAKINLYGMYSFHFYCWNQFKVIPVECTLRTGTYPQRFRFGSDADHGIMRYICNHQEAPWTTYSKWELLLGRLDLIHKYSGSQMSVRPSVRTYVRPSLYKSYFDFNEIWHVYRGRWVMHDGMQYDPIQGQGQGHEFLKVGNPFIFEGYLLPHLQ